MKFCCRTTLELVTTVSSDSLRPLGGQFKPNSFWDETVGLKVEKTPRVDSISA